MTNPYNALDFPFFSSSSFSPPFFKKKKYNKVEKFGCEE